MFIKMMFSVAVKSRTFSSFSYSANEQVCRSWGESIARQIAKLANGNSPYHKLHAQFMNGSWPGGEICQLFRFCEFFEYSLG